MTAALDPTVLAWALARPSGDRWRSLAEAFAGGTTRVSVEGRMVEYRSLAEIGAALTAGYGAESGATRRPGLTLAGFSRGSA
jgi:hypothetical protein